MGMIIVGAAGYGLAVVSSLIGTGFAIIAIRAIQEREMKIAASSILLTMLFLGFAFVMSAITYLVLR